MILEVSKLARLSLPPLQDPLCQGRLLYIAVVSMSCLSSFVRLLKSYPNLKDIFENEYLIMFLSFNPGHLPHLHVHHCKACYQNHRACFPTKKL